jgi:hypothetical protein
VRRARLGSNILSDGMAFGKFVLGAMCSDFNPA